MDDRRGIIYFVAGTKHCVHAIVSVMSLRDHYKGPVALITEADGAGRRCCEQIAADDRLGPIKVIADATMKAGGHGVSYFCKTLLPRVSPFDVTLFLDADTLVIGSLDEAWPEPAGGEVTLTQFADWVSTGGKMRQRILGWQDVEPERVARQLEKPWPALNTGVVGWSRQSESFTEDWTHTCRKRPCFMADESAAQLIFPDHPHRILDDRFNASVIFPRTGEEVLTREDVRVLHGHGMKFWKRPQGWRLYGPSYARALRDNYGGIRSIAPHAKAFSYIPHDDQELLRAYWQSPLATVK